MRRMLTRRHKEMALHFLGNNPRENAFMIGNILCFGIAYGSRYLRNGQYYGFFHSRTQDLCGLLALYNNSQCMVYCSDAAVADEMAGFLDKHSSLAILGPADTIEMMALRMKTIHLYTRERQLFMEQPEETNTPAVHVVDARKQWRNVRVRFFVSRCMEECFGYRLQDAIIARMLRERTRPEVFYLAEVDGDFVAQAHIQAWSDVYAQIGGVAVPKEFRRNGYAAGVIGALAAHGRKYDRIPCLLVEPDNTAAMNLYQKLGFIPTGEIGALCMED